MFKSSKTVPSADGGGNAQGIEILLEKESDGKWRLVLERIQSADETKQHKLSH